MNERIEKLAVEATKYSNTLMIDYLDLSDEDYKEKYNQEYNKKFAELIVRECAEVGSYGAGPTDTDLIKRSVLQHFGVEE
jgi:hypothetical protein